MGIVSYAQNFEDVMLWRALKHVEKGFYVDIGAQDPLVDSVSFAFYENGWRGVHVEPTQQYSDKLRLARPDEIVLQVAIGDQVGTLTFYEFEDTGLSTADIDISRRHKEAGFCCSETLVPVISLDALFERIGAQDIHWLKLDVEGLEKAVLESWRCSSVFTLGFWLLKALDRMTQEQSHDEWEQLLLDKGYRYVYFDGLNRFYVSPNHLDLVKAFCSPPNIFDGFVLSGTASQSFFKLVESKALQAENKAQQAESRAQQAESRAQQAESRAQQAESRAQQSEMQVQAVYHSTSWRVTQPLRWMFGGWKQLVKRGLRWIYQKIVRAPWLLAQVKSHLSRFPKLEGFVLRVISAPILAPTNQAEVILTDQELKSLMDIKDANYCITRRAIMKIVIDLQACQAPESKNRGIGRYSLSLAKAIIQVGIHHEFWVLLNTSYPETIEALRATFAQQIATDHFITFTPVESAREVDSGNPYLSHVSEAIRNSLIEKIAPDAVLICSLFEGAQDSCAVSVPNSSAVLHAVVLYDLIPLLNSDRYLSNSNVKAWYMRKVGSLARADLLLGISESASQEALGADLCAKSNVVTISSAVDSTFFTSAIEDDSDLLVPKKYGLLSHSLCIRAALIGVKY